MLLRYNRREMWRLFAWFEKFNVLWWECGDDGNQIEAQTRAIAIARCRNCYFLVNVDCVWLKIVHTIDSIRSIFDYERKFVCSMRFDYNRLDINGCHTLTQFDIEFAVDDLSLVEKFVDAVMPKMFVFYFGIPEWSSTNTTRWAPIKLGAKTSKNNNEWASEAPI